MKKEGLFFERLPSGSVKCGLCAHLCEIQPGKFGFCGVRQNISGVLYSHVYGEVIAAHVDPIEKKPLYHFLPGSASFSLAAPGCNFRCGFCQNWEISQMRADKGWAGAGEYRSPEDIVDAAAANRCASISYTYTEPTVFFEYCLDVARLARKRGIRNVFVTNGYMTPAAIDAISPYLDAANVDLKFFDDSMYRKVCAGSLKPVLVSIEGMRRKNIWVEVTTLLIPGQNDSRKDLEGFAGYLAGVDKDIPWHISKFFPNYKYMDIDPTSDSSLRGAVECGLQAGIRYVYAGNVHGWGSATQCHQCGKTLIERSGFSVVSQNVKKGKCGFCGAVIPGVWVDNGNSSEAS
jgi:pyruvate formate lyase activating enzyme